MAEIAIYAGEDQMLVDEYGLGFFGDGGFGAPISLNEYNGRTFLTDASGVEEGFECNNNKRASTTGVIHGQAGSGISLVSLPNTLATINVRFTNSFSVRTQSAKFYVYDGTSTIYDVVNYDNDPSGLTCYCAQIRHTNESQEADGLGDTNWQDIHGATYLSLVSSPGASGFRPDGSFTSDARHDWYVAISPTPTHPGNKMFGMYFELEYL